VCEGVALGVSSFAVKIAAFVVKLQAFLGLFGGFNFFILVMVLSSVCYTMPKSAKKLL